MHTARVHEVEQDGTVYSPTVTPISKPISSAKGYMKYSFPLDIL
jgi:hypothetical protein